MDLNDHSSFHNIDHQNYLAEIENLPNQLEIAFQSGMSLALPEWQDIQRVLIAGMGGSAIGADLVAAYAASCCRLPIIVQRNYYLPAWAKGPETLVVASSHSGNTEETLAAFEMAMFQWMKDNRKNLPEPHIEKTLQVEINGRFYWYQSYLTRSGWFWQKLHWPEEELLKTSIT